VIRINAQQLLYNQLIIIRKEVIEELQWPNEFPRKKINEWILPRVVWKPAKKIHIPKAYMSFPFFSVQWKKKMPLVPFQQRNHGLVK